MKYSSNEIMDQVTLTIKFILLYDKFRHFSIPGYEIRIRLCLKEGAITISHSHFSIDTISRRS